MRHRVGAATDQAIVGLAHALLVVKLSFFQLASFAAWRGDFSARRS